MDDHDDKLCPVNMTLGWNKAIGVHSQYPDVVNPEDFPSPDWVVSGGTNDVQASRSGLKAAPHHSGSSSSI